MKIIKSLLSACALFASFAVEAAAPAGQWWFTNFDHRIKITVPAGASALATGYAVPVTFNHNAAVAATESVASGDDVRIVYWNGTTWVELDRVLDPDSTWNSTGTIIWFKTQSAITAGNSDDNYYLYYGDTAVPGTPLADPEVVWSLFDDFSGGFDTGRWSRSNNTNVTVAGGVLTINGGRQLRSNATFGLNTIYEVRSLVSNTAPSNPQYYLSGDNDCTDYTFDGYIRFRADNTAVDTLQNSAGTIAAPTTFTATSPTAYQLYSFTREAAGAGRFFHNGVQITTFTGANTAAMCMFMRNEAGTTTHTQQYEWARVRPYRNPEPVPTSAALEMVSMPTVAGEWRFNQTSWTGAANEVLDSGPNALHMTAFGSATTANATPAIAGDPGTCRYGNFNGTNQYVQVADNAALDLPNRITVTAWIYPRSLGTDLKSILSKDTNYEFHLNSAGQLYWWWGGGAQSLTTTVSVPLNQWTHVAVTYESGMQRIYLNGVMRASGTTTGTLATNTLPFQIGQDQGLADRFWNGLIDEVKVYGAALSQAQVNTVMTQTNPCSNAHHFLIAHDGYGITCAAVENVSVTVHDSLHNQVASYNRQITLDTQTGRGTWTLVSGAGTFLDATANDGLATYTFPGTQATATFALDYRSATPPGTSPPGLLALDIDAYETSTPTIRDDDTEGTMNFAPSGFTVTSAALTNPPPATIPAFTSPQIAGTTFPVHITAYGQTPTDTTCGVIEGYTGAKSVKFWSTYANPNTGTIQVTINGTAASTTEGASAVQAVTFTNGQAVVNAKYKDVGQLSISLKDDVSAALNPGLTTGIRGGTGNFISKPHNILLAPITRTDGTINSGTITDHTSTVFIAAGRPFRTTLTVRDAENSATPNFGRETPAEALSLVPTLVSPSGGNNPPIARSGTHTYVNGVSNNGVTSVADFSWPEVGVIQLTPHILDSDYMSTGDVSGNTSVNVGRFVPDRFDMSASAAQLQTACTNVTAPHFTYYGQPFRYLTPPVVTATAKAFTGETTRNYVGNYYRLSASSLTRTYQPSAGLDTSFIPAGDSTMTQLSGANAGLTTVSFTLGTLATQGLAYLRTTPVAPTTTPPAITLNVSLTDADLVASTPAPFVVGSPSGIPFNTTNELRYGRIAFRNAIGSEQLNLPLTMRAEYFLSASAGFIQNVNDNCTTGVSVPAPALAAYGGNLNQGETCLLDTGSPGTSGFGCSVAAPVAQQFKMPPVAGDFNAILRAPGSTAGVPNNGTVTVTATVPSWLKFDWNTSAAGEENPSGIATFGIFQGESKRIFQTEK